MRSKTVDGLLRMALYVLCALFATAAEAQDITQARLVGIGSANLLDTYLSQEKYSGYDIRYLSHTLREDSTRWKRVMIHQGEFASASNRSENGTMIVGMYNFQFGFQREIGRWNAGNGTLLLDVGCRLDANTGFVYNTRNSNNPAQARAYLNITPALAGAYRFMIRNHPYTLHYDLEVPLAGVMFSPNYGQSYYEIFSRGNYDHNIVATWPGNAPNLRHLLTMDATLGKLTFRVGYLGDFRQARVNGLKNHLYTHALMIGVVRKFQLIKKQP